jgi:hypothetical protein
MNSAFFIGLFPSKTWTNLNSQVYETFNHDKIISALYCRHDEIVMIEGFINCSHFGLTFTPKTKICC